MRRTVLKTCGRSRTWQMVQMPSRASATATPLRLLRDLLEHREHALVERRDERRALGGDALERRPCSSACSAVIACAVGVDRLLLGGELRFRRLDAPPSGRRPRASARASCLRGVLISPCAKLDLLLDGVVLLVGLHRHRLLAELRQAALLHGDVLLDRAARVLVLGELRPSRRRRAARAASRRVSSAFSCSGSSASLRLAASAVGVEPLEGDQSFEIRVHRYVQAKKRPRRAEPECYTVLTVHLRGSRFGGHFA